MTKPKGYFVIKVASKFVSSFTGERYELTDNSSDAMRFYDDLERIERCCFLLFRKYKKKQVNVYANVSTPLVRYF